jgi:NAD(P)-dependent dehydrogenase (short-subunit alcohol dehydrogenase family)
VSINGKFNLEGKNALITGGGSGLGRAMSLAMADAGANVIVSARRMPLLEETVALVEAKGRRALALPADLTVSEQVNRMTEQAIAEFGRIDILVNNAGITEAGRGKMLPELTDEEWRIGIDVNLTTAFYCSRAIINHFLEHGGGKIINVTSGWGMRGGRGNFMYSVAKGGVIQLTKALAMTYARDNIRCTCIAPGLIPKGIPQEARDERGKVQPVGRVGWPYEMGPLAVFLASDMSDYMSGETVLLDGGSIAGGVTPAGLVPVAEG